MQGGGGAAGGGMDGGMQGGGGGSGNAIPGLGGQMPGIGGPGGAGETGQYPGETAAERQRRLEGELEESVGGFDEVLGEEQREVATVGRNTEGFGGGGSGGGNRVGLGRQASMGGGVEGTGEGADAGEAGGGGGGSTASVATMDDDEIESRTPSDIPDLVSEDIVAKQLREAALAEDDPELRERLWDEYRKYNGLQ